VLHAKLVEASAAYYGLPLHKTEMPKTALTGHPLYPMLTVAPPVQWFTSPLSRKPKSSALRLSMQCSMSVRLLWPRPICPASKTPAIAAAGVLVSGRFGADLVCEHGVRVKGASPIAGAPELKLPGDEAMKHAMLAQEKRAPARRPASSSARPMPAS
jgi:hypothetical protein